LIVHSNTKLVNLGETSVSFFCLYCCQTFLGALRPRHLGFPRSVFHCFTTKIVALLFGHCRGFITDLSHALGLKQHESSQYGTFETPDGKRITIRVSNHNARVSNFDKNNESEGISIVISSHKNKGLHNDGNAHIIEYFYPKRALENAEGKPLAEMIRSVSDTLAGEEFKDTTGLAEREEVNGSSVREHRVYHGSGADFDAFDHSHMGEGEGAQAYGWGTYVTDVEGIGRTYAIQTTTKLNDGELRLNLTMITE
jgi:hypothetical protein